MALILPVNGIEPKFGANCYLADNATVVGDVAMGNDCSVWFTAVVRGDVHYIRIGNKVNIQDGAIIHCTYQKSPTTIGNFVSIGHRAIVHGCTIEDNVLIGMGAIVLESTIVESNTIYAGIPARKVKDLDENNFKNLIERIGNNYVMYAGWFRK
jgi:carbonic anhydrase/acetyltransferase-like protein (isoleucine patch superfamily)